MQTSRYELIGKTGTAHSPIRIDNRSNLYQYNLTTPISVQDDDFLCLSLPATDNSSLILYTQERNAPNYVCHGSPPCVGDYPLVTPLYGKPLYHDGAHM